ncbi:MAG: exosome complex protein Rrp42 [archaeon]
MLTNDYITSLAKTGKRLDTRKMDEYRKIQVEYGVSSKSAEGSARVKIGETEIIAGVKIDVGTPYPDKMDEGTIMVNAELLPMSSPRYESGPPSIDSIEISRVVDRGIRECHALDFKKLCIVAGEKVWMVFIDIYPINADGNLFDACALAAIAALKDAKFPALDKDNNIDYKTRTKNPLPISKLPVSCTVLKVGGQFLVDPSIEEEDAATARLTIAFTDSGNICAMQKGGDESITFEEVSKMVDFAKKATEQMRKAL